MQTQIFTDVYKVSAAKPGAQHCMREQHLHCHKTELELLGKLIPIGSKQQL